MAGYGQQFYTRQEQEDAYASRLEPNPNRVGSGFVNYGPQVPQTQPATNWQTATCLGQGTATPAQVSQIWNLTPAPPVPQPALQQQRMPPQQLQPQVQPQLGAFAALPQEPKDVSAIFQSLGIDTTAAAPPPQMQAALVGGSQQPAGFPGVASVPLAFPTGLNPVSAMSAAAVQQPFVNGHLGVPGVPAAARVPVPSVPQQPQPQPQSLMSLLQTPVATPALNTSAFAPLGNGTVPQASCASRAQAAFSNPGPPAPQCQLPQNGVMSGANAFAPNTHAAAFASSAGQPARPPVPAQPKSLSTASDYANAASNYKAPPTRAAISTTSIARKPETSKTSSQPATQKEEWECPRCTFLNNSALWECEMCGFERAGKQQLPTSEASDDGGWHTASRTPSKSVPVQNNNNNVPQSGKSKAQSKNEKRRAKKRGDP